MSEDNQKAGQASAEKAEIGATREANDYFADFNFSDVEKSLLLMLKSGVHFGHQKSRKHPSMNEYVYTTRKGINIIDLQKTSEKLDEALEFLKTLKESGKKVLFVGTKKQSHDLIKSIAKRLDMPFVVDRWLGGTFTNFKNIKGRTKYLKDQEDLMAKGEFKKYTKFEQAKKNEELEKMEGKMGGIKDMMELPGAIFVIDLKADNLAVKEAKKMGVQVIALADTNVDASEADYVIPANDDAISSIRIILSYVGKTLIKEN
jgi:small subunit ribosomal protein S2